MKMLNKCLALAISLSVSIISAQSSQADENGWILTQHSKILGDQYIYISTHGVKCVNPKQGIGWVTQTPRWNITFFNDKTKLYYSVSSSSWKNKIAKNDVIPSNLTWSKVSSGSIAGLKASEYKMVNNTPSAKWHSATYWLANDIEVPKSLAQLISSACGLPASDSIPLQLSYLSQRGNTETLLSTSRQQTAALPDSYFTTPTNYKIARSEVEVLVSQENRALIDELANDLTSDSPRTKINPQLINASKQITPENINKLPDQINVGGKTVSKDQINKFLDRLKSR